MILIICAANWAFSSPELCQGQIVCSAIQRFVSLSPPTLLLSELLFQISDQLRRRSVVTGSLNKATARLACSKRRSGSFRSLFSTTGDTPSSVRRGTGAIVSRFSEAQPGMALKQLAGRSISPSHFNADAALAEYNRWTALVNCRALKSPGSVFYEGRAKNP